MTVGHPSSLWRVEVAHSHDPNPPPQTLTVSGWGWGIRVRGMGYHAPTPQAGRVTDSHGGEGGWGGDEGWGGGEGSTMPYMDLER